MFKASKKRPPGIKMTVASHHTQICFDTWIQCESLLANIAGLKNSLSKKFFKVVDECAMICMGTFHAIKSGSQHIHRMALLCVGICEECAELCDTHADKQFREFAATCRQCSESMTEIAFTNLQ
jgi:hypothetical protein